jgi:hypothetical protein
LVKVKGVNALLVGVTIATYIFMMALGAIQQLHGSKFISPGLTFKGEKQKMLKSNGGIYGQ